MLIGVRLYSFWIGIGSGLLQLLVFSTKMAVTPELNLKMTCTLFERIYSNY